MNAPIVVEHDGIRVVRDDLFAGETKARYLIKLFDQCSELVYASPAEGGAQTALAHCARITGKKLQYLSQKDRAPTIGLYWQRNRGRKYCR